jgi:acylphosphatase
MTDFALRLIITGRVQGVGFRIWMRQEALRRGLRGWVRNRHDGSVEALIIGEQAAVEALVAACHRGPAMARVVGVRRALASNDGSRGFEERMSV